MSDPDPTVARLVAELEAFLYPVTEAVDDEFQREQLIEALGGNLEQLSQSDRDQLETALGEIVSSFEALQSLLEDSPSSMDLLSVLGETADIFLAVADVGEVLVGTPLDDIAGSVIDYLAMRYLASEHPALIQVAYGLTIIRVHETDSGDLPPEFYSDLFPQRLPEVASFEPRRVSDLLSDPLEALKETYLSDGQVSPQTVMLVSQYLMPNAQVAIGKLGFDCALSFVDESVSSIDGHPDLTVVSQYLNAAKELDDGTTFGFDLALGVNASRPAVVLFPYGNASFEFASGAWSITLGITGQFDVVVVDSGGLVADSDQSEIGEVGVHGEIARTTPTDGSVEPTRIGSTDGTRLEVGRLALTSDLTGDPESGQFDANVLASAGDANLTVAAGDGDGFIQKILPKDGLSVDFDAGIGYASGRGLYFEGGGAGLAADLPIQFSIGEALKIPSLHLAAKPDQSGEIVSIPVEVSASPQVKLGPIGATVEQIGLEADVTFPENKDGNLGALDVHLGFKPPSGAGLSVDASAVVGGGYLNFDPENERYSGTLQLKIGSLTLTAVGLLTTQLPDGRDGFSLLVIITGEFPAVQLGFGFTLNGLGGLLGINRGTKVEALRAGLRDGTTKSILFPKDPMRNAPRIVSDLRGVFPPTSARHVFGPMAKLGWGTPPIMTAEIGVLISLPSPVKLVILGRLHAALPDDEAALVVFNMDAIGVVDFGAKEGSIDATLYDSRIVAYTLTGDMAMRTNWGDDPDFALSVGGFHPKFDPPEGFPELRRIALTLGSGNPRIRWSGYFAITSNSVQAGAKVELYAAAAGFSVSGHLGFDALFQFDPFKLLVDIAAGFAIKRGGTTLLSAQLKGSLKGPNPWHVRGKASFEIWPFEFSVNVDATFGERSDPEPLPPADVLGQVVSALGDERNWTAQLPEGGESVVTLRKMEREAGTVLAHPLGTLAVRQQVAPLGVTIEKFGNAKPATYTKYTVASVSVAGQSQSVEAGDTREQFAPAQFFEMSDAEKLQRPSFERYSAGTEVGNSLFAHGGMRPDESDQVRTAELVYETSIVDKQASPFPMYWKRLAMPHATAVALTEVSAVARGPLRTTGTAKFAGTDDASGPTGVDASVSISNTAYVVARTSDLRQVSIPEVPSEGTTRRETEEALDEFLAASERDDAAYRIVAGHEAASPEVQP